MILKRGRKIGTCNKFNSGIWNIFRNVAKEACFHSMFVPASLVATSTILTFSLYLKHDPFILIVSIWTYYNSIRGKRFHFVSVQSVINNEEIMSFGLPLKSLFSEVWNPTHATRNNEFVPIFIFVCVLHLLLFGEVT